MREALKSAFDHQISEGLNQKAVVFTESKRTQKYIAAELRRSGYSEEDILRYKTMFKFEEDHIVISSQKEAAAFIKMLNDDIVRSELTGKEYDSSSKMLLGPVGASH